MTRQARLWILVAAVLPLAACQPSPDPQPEVAAEAEAAVGAPAAVAEGVELPVSRIPHLGEAAEAYFSPDGESLICNAKHSADDESYHVTTLRLDGSDIRRINDRGHDACAYYFPDGQRLIWTSTRDHMDIPLGDFSNPESYPQGSELYTSALDGSDVVRLTDNLHYDAEVSLSPDGEWILFTRQIDGRLDLWRMRPDGSDERQITETPDWQEGGSFYLPDSETILYRAWKIEDQGQRGMPMTLFTIRHDGTGLRQLTHDRETNWAPYPAPDGKHFVFVKFLRPRNFEIFLGNLESGEQRQLTFHDAFDGYPSISRDGRTLVFTSSRDAPPGERKVYLYTMDISSLGVEPA